MTLGDRQPRRRRPLGWLLARSFAARVAFATSGLIVVACGVLSWFQLRRDFAEIRRSMVDRGRTIGEFLAREAELSVLSGNLDGLMRLAKIAQAQPDIVYCRFFDAEGTMLVSFPADLPGGVNRPTDIWETVGPVDAPGGVWEFETPIFTSEVRVQREELLFDLSGAAAHRQGGSLKRAGVVAIGVFPGPLEQHRRVTLLTVGLLTALVIVLAVVSAAAVAQAFARPLRELAAAADTIAAGDFTTTVRVAGTDEVAAVAESFNEMVKSLAESRSTLEEYSRALEVRSQRLETLNRELMEANRLKSEFLAQVSHELRTPLNVIIGYAAMISDGVGGPVTAEQHEMLAAIHRYSRMQLDLVTDVLDFSRLTSGSVSLRVARFPLGPVLEEIVALYRERSAGTPREFVLHVASDIPELQTDRVKLQEIVRNLVDNAAKFTPAGTITVAATANGACPGTTIEVSDTGAGIATEELDRIFDEFHQVGESSTRATQGVGLGLSIVKRLVGVLGGSITVTSRLGVGSTFRVQIPASVVREPSAAI